MKLKSIILSVLLAITVASVGMFSSGCASTSSGQATPEQKAQTVAKTAAIVKMSAQLGTYYAVRKDSNLRPYFSVTSGVIDGAVSQGVFDPTKLDQLIREANGGTASPDVIIAITAAVNLYQIYLADKVPLNIPPDEKAGWVVPVLKGLSEGIRIGLDASVTERTFRLPPPPR